MRHLYTDTFASSYFPRLKDVCEKTHEFECEEIRSFDMSKIESLLEKLSVLLPMATRNTRSEDDAMVLMCTMMWKLCFWISHFVS